MKLKLKKQIEDLMISLKYIGKNRNKYYVPHKQLLWYYADRFGSFLLVYWYRPVSSIGSSIGPLLIFRLL